MRLRLPLEEVGDPGADPVTVWAGGAGAVDEDEIAEWSSPEGAVQERR
jgi:hypothetical protein